MKKLSFSFLLVFIFFSCNSTKHVAEDEHMLTRNYIFIDNVENKRSDLQKYILQKPNPRFLNLPLALYFHNIGNRKKPKTPSEWRKKNPQSYNFIKKVFSEKQSIGYANSSIQLNNWFLNSLMTLLASSLNVLSLYCFPCLSKEELSEFL